ncbi:MAG TPA: hypothetical protein VKV19_02865, partial [Ktedonobacteraceae bacterium]|nr:hypothetical protein [Ktedonobacteraceae bacterium]
ETEAGSRLYIGKADITHHIPKNRHRGPIDRVLSRFIGERLPYDYTVFPCTCAANAAGMSSEWQADHVAGGPR